MRLPLLVRDRGGLLASPLVGPRRERRADRFVAPLGELSVDAGGGFGGDVVEHAVDAGGEEGHNRI